MINTGVKYTHREIMETIVYVLLAEAIYLTSKNLLFNDLKLQNDSDDDKNHVIHNAIKNKFMEINDDRRDFINNFLISTEGLITFNPKSETDKKILANVQKYIENMFSRDKDKYDELMGNFRSVVFRILCLKCYNLYEKQYYRWDHQTIKNKCPITFKYLFHTFGYDYACNCFNTIKQHGNLDMFISTVGNYDIRQARFGGKVFDKILCLSNEDNHKFLNFYCGWVTPKQKQQYIKEAEQKYTQYTPKKDDNDIYNSLPVLKSKKEQEKQEQPKQEEPKPNCEKKDSKNIE